jgi:hypothetical protein
MQLSKGRPGLSHLVGADQIDSALLPMTAHAVGKRFGKAKRSAREGEALLVVIGDHLLYFLQGDAPEIRQPEYLQDKG